MQNFKSLLIIHGAYLLVAALWPILDINSFVHVTGHKTDTWLIKSMSLVLLPASLCFLAQYFARPYNWEPVAILGASLSAVLAWVDFYYVLNGVIPGIYLVDGVIQLVLMASWFYLLAGRLQRPGI
jgi:hypothetical protein